jgi:hypothetical protein
MGNGKAVLRNHTSSIGEELTGAGKFTAISKTIDTNSFKVRAAAKWY